jgi:hypothetical protein
VADQFFNAEFVFIGPIKNCISVPEIYAQKVFFFLLLLLR